MTYFKLINNQWTESKYDVSAKHILVYDLIDGIMTPIGIGQY